MKNSAVDLTDLALGIVVLGIVVSVGAIILIGVRDASLSKLSTFTTTNETVTADNVTATPLTNAWFNTETSVVNASDASQTLTSGTNYTITTNSVTGQGELLAISPRWDGVDLNVTYSSYNTSEPQWALPNDAAVGLAEYGDWFDIIVIVGIAAVILALIFMAFGGRGSSAGIGGSY